MFKSFINLIVSLLNVGKHLFIKPVTLEYPEKKNVKPDNFRGVPIVKDCVKCGNCIRVCPAGAIIIENDKFIVDLNKCIFCGNCEYYCSEKAIKMSGNYEIATNNKKDLRLIYDIKKAEVKDV